MLPTLPRCAPYVSDGFFLNILPVMAINVAIDRGLLTRGFYGLATYVTAHRDLSHARVTIITTLNAPFPSIYYRSLYSKLFV